MCAVEVGGPRGPLRYGGTDMLTWAHNQVGIASEIMDNPGGGLLFATQTIGQVRAALNEAAPEQWRSVVGLLDQAESEAVRRRFERARELLRQTAEALSERAKPGSTDSR